MADQFGIDTRDVIVLQDRTRVPIYDLAPYYETAHYCKASPSRVWELRNSGLGWGQVAHKLGMHPGTFNKLRNQGAFDRDRFWTRAYRDRFAVTDQQITVLRRDNGSLENVLGAIIVGKLINKDPQLVYDQFQTQRSWTAVTNNYNVRFEDWRKVARPVKTVYRIPTAKSNSGVRDVGAGVGTGKSQGAIRSSGKGQSGAKSKGGGKSGISKSTGQGVAKGHGKGNSNGGGQGKGNSGGKGKGKGG